MASKKTRSKRSGSKKTGSKKTASKKGVAKGGTSAGGKGKSKLSKLSTQFMADFTAQFIGDPTKIGDPGSPVNRWPDPDKGGTPTTRVWPESGQKMPGILADYATFVNVLMTVGNHGTLPPPAPGSLADHILQFLNKAPTWPDNTKVPPEYALEKTTVHLVEIAVILDRLLQAINSFNIGDGAGGGGSNWPPHT